MSLAFMCVVAVSSGVYARPIDWSDSTQHLALAFGGLARPDPTTGTGHRTEEYVGSRLLPSFDTINLLNMYPGLFRDNDPYSKCITQVPLQRVLTEMRDREACMKRPGPRYRVAEMVIAQ